MFLDLLKSLSLSSGKKNEYWTILDIQRVKAQFNQRLSNTISMGMP